MESDDDVYDEFKCCLIFLLYNASFPVQSYFSYARSQTTHLSREIDDHDDDDDDDVVDDVVDH